MKEGKVLYASIEWDILNNGQVLESQMMVCDNLKEAINHCKKYAHPKHKTYVEKFYSNEVEDMEVVWGEKS